MSLKEKINEDIKTAMKAKDQDALRALRGIKSMILLAETSEGHQGELTDAQELQLLSKAIKQRKDSAETYLKQGRQDLASVEQAEIEIISRYMPAQLTEEQLREKLTALIAQLGVSSAKEMGKVIGAANQALAGQAEGKAIAAMVKSLLS